MKKKSIITAAIIFSALFLGMLAVLAVSIGRTGAYNSKQHHAVFSAEALFSQDGAEQDGLLVRAAPRDSTWSKIFDFNNEGLTEYNYQAFTYDFSFMNDTKDTVSDFKFRLYFDQEAYLSSAWNGSLEIHQQVKNRETVAAIPDLRDYNPDDYKLSYFKRQLQPIRSCTGATCL